MISAERESAGAATPVALSPDRRKPGGLAVDLLSLPALAGIALAAGLSLNALRSSPLSWVYETKEHRMDTAVQQVSDGHGTKATPDPVPAQPTHEIRLEDFQKFVADRKGLVLDARPAMFFGGGHVPGAINLPSETFAEDYPRLRETLEQHKDQEIAVYCSGADCPDAELLAEALTKLGYRRLLIYTSGWDEWSQTGLPQEKGILRP